MHVYAKVSRQKVLLILILTLCVCVSARQAQAQNLSSSGSNWSSGWGFASPSDRSLSLQRAQAIRQAQTGTGPSTIVNTTNYNSADNRSNYIENITDQGSIHSDLHVGDSIGSNTNSVGSMNTGSTTITIDGTGNTIDANNFAENAGCVDGSINSASSSGLSPDRLEFGTVRARDELYGTGTSNLSVSAQTCR